MALTEQDVVRIARLARIALTPDQLTRAEHELNGMLDIIAKLQSVDTTGVEPLAHPLSALAEVSLRLREDTVTETASVEQRQALLANAPATAEGVFLVPKVIE